MASVTYCLAFDEEPESSVSPTPVLAVARDNFFVITPDNSLVGWETNEYRLVNSLNDNQVPFEQRRVIMADAKAICFGTYCVFVLDTEGNLYGCGADIFG